MAAITRRFIGRMDRIRYYYDVPARRGMRVRMNGKPGKIVGSVDMSLRVLFDGERYSQPCHPDWEMEYEIEPDEWVRKVRPTATREDAPLPAVHPRNVPCLGACVDRRSFALAGQQPLG